ncbi:iron complex transport system substrate-binding protein [Tindallia magadiensis]|uniref:Iron complex transport system substrate-binding protein n=1 Tax=Tindallia magadiensis TaxID=69895 RepID=A0A1I3GQ67_9FIRM|nr:ABC transporter substrate-binding protein [Tindallia magadiensis]SFI25566.1 iron complex transport system substrate-binding protein [Tindallia magadiensis]
MNREKRKKFFSKRMIPVTFALLLILMTGCGSGHSGAESVEKTEAEETVEAEQEVAAIRTIMDQSGRLVEIPEDIERVVMTALPFPSIYAITGEPISKVAGMHPGSRGAIENSIMGDMYPELLDVPSGFIEGTDINIEELLKLDPDVVFYWADYANQTKQLEEAGITAIGVNTQGDGDALLTLQSWLEIMGEVFNQQDQVGEVIDYGSKVSQEIEKVTADLEEEEKPRSLFLFRHDSQEIIVPGAGHYGDVWIESTGGVNVAKEIDVTAAVNMEQIYQWNPEIIFITSFTATTPQDLYDNTIEGQDWSQVEAVKNRRVYKVPVGVYRWYPPSGDVPLMMKWMALHQHPELFSYDMEQEVKTYYQEFHEFDLTEEQVIGILNPLSETSEGTSGLSRQR